MKKILVIITLVSVSFFAKAQTSAGNMMLGGGVSISSNNYGTSNDNDNSGFELSPSFGYFVKDNLVIGASVSLSSYRSGIGTGQSKTFGFGLGPFARFYKFTSNEQFAFFGTAGLSFGSTRNETGNTVNYRATGITFYAAPGFAYFFNEHWAGEFSFSLLSISSSNYDNNASDRTSVNFGINSFSPSIGFRYHFRN